MSSYAPLRHDIWSDADFLAVGPDAKLVYLLLISHRKLSRCGVLDLVPARWANATGLSVDRVEGAVAELEKQRFVVVDRGTHELAVRSKVKHDQPRSWMQVKSVWSAWQQVDSGWLRDVLAFEFTDECFTSDKVAPGCERPSTSPLDTHSEWVSDTHSDTHSDTQSRANTLTKHLALSTTHSVDRVDDEFDRFWSLYPRKVGKGAAKKAWDKALKRAGPNEILEGLQRIAPTWTDPQFIPHPTTWLNRDGWLDQPDPPKLNPSLAAVVAVANRAGGTSRQADTAGPSTNPLEGS